MVSHPLASCHICTHDSRIEEPCSICGNREHAIDPSKSHEMWIWWFAGVIFYIPSLMLPIMTLVQFGFTRERSIMGGVVDLMEHQNYILAAIVFVASIIIPITKLLILAILFYLIKYIRPLPSIKMQKAYSFIDWIGRWSMIDVFVVCVLGALIQLGSITNIKPGIAIIPFALAVICTMMATHKMDERLFWNPPQ